MRDWMLAIGCMASLAVAQEPELSKAALDAQAAAQRGEYMAAHRLLDAATFGPDGKAKDFFAYQMWQQITPMLTSELPLDALTQGEAPAPLDPAVAARVRRTTARPAIDEIVRRARQTSIVILNEAHHSPRDRAFGLEVARALRPFGYTYLAAEAFNTGPDAAKSPAVARLAADGVVRRDTGFYTQDPVFAAYVREAVRLGYRPVAYESNPAQPGYVHGIQGREDGQAKNLMAAIFAHEPRAKVLIHVGHGHVNEMPFRGDDGIEYFMMAARLKQLTGIDPLTISQTVLTDLQPAMRNAYPIAAAKAGKRDIVLFDGARPLLLGKTPATDLQVVHPARSYRYGRPAWLAGLGGLPATIPSLLLPRAGDRLVQAFAAEAPVDAVPLDQVLVTAGRPVPKLMLPRGVPVRYATQP